MANDIVHTLEDFKDIPWHELTPDRCSRDWTYGWGGHGFPNSQLTITICRKPSLDFEIWPLPDPIAAMMKMNAEIEVKELKRSFRRLIDAAEAE